MEGWDYFLQQINSTRPATRLHEILSGENLLHSRLCLEALRENADVDSEFGDDEMSLGFEAILDQMGNEFIQGCMMGIIFSLDDYNKKGIMMPLDRHNRKMINVYSALKALLIERMGEM